MYYLEGNNALCITIKRNKKQAHVLYSYIKVAGGEAGIYKVFAGVSSLLHVPGVVLSVVEVVCLY